MVANGWNVTEQSTTQVVERNITALLKHRLAEEDALSWHGKLAGKIAAFAGSMSFVGVHILLYGAWVVVNLGLIPGIAPFDPSFVILATLASVEGIFLSTFILITQNRMQAHADRRADLTLQISLLAEHEITRLVKMVTEIGDRMNIESAQHPDLTELKQDIRPEKVLDILEKREAAHQGAE